MAAPAGLVAEQVGLELERRCLVGAAATMRIGRGEVEEKGPLASGLDQSAAGFGHLDGVATVAPQHRFELIDLFGRHVKLADPSGPVAGPRQGPRERQADHVIPAGKLVEVVLMAVLAVGMVVEAREDHRPAGRTTGGGGEGVFK